MRRYNMHVFFSKFNLYIGLCLVAVFVTFLVTENYGMSLRDYLLALLGFIFIVEEITKSVSMQYTYLFVRIMQFFKQCILSLLIFFYLDCSIVVSMCFLLYFYISFEFLIMFRSQKIETRVASYGQMIIPLVIVFILEIVNENYLFQEIVIFTILFSLYVCMIRIIEKYLILSDDFEVKSNGSLFKVDKHNNLIFQDDSKISARIISRMLGLQETEKNSNACYYDKTIKFQDLERFLEIIDISYDVQYMAKEILKSLDGIDYVLIMIKTKNSNRTVIGNESIIGNDIIKRTKNAIKNGEFNTYMNENEEYFLDNVVSLDKYSFFLEEDNINSLISYPLKMDSENIGLCMLASRTSDYFRLEAVKNFKFIIEQLIHRIERISVCRMLEQLSIKDALTGIYNRRYLIEFFNEISNEVNNLNPNKFKMSVSLFDIDRFKIVNDTYGHLFGDKVIRVCTKIANDIVLKNKGIIARYGGEEFVIIFQGKNIEETELILSEIKKQINSYDFLYNEKVVKINISVGITAYPDISESVENLLNDADKAMYYSKENGRGRITIYNKKLENIMKI